MLRQRGLTRGAGPEHNLVQAPQVSRGLQQVLGIRQAHVAPVMGDTLQPVVVVEDTRDHPLSARPRTAAMFRNLLGSGVDPTGRMMLINPSNSGVVVDLLQVSVYNNGSSGDIAFTITDTVQQGLGTNPGVVNGLYLFAGTPPVGRTDYPLPSGGQSFSAVGVRNLAGPVISPYFWERPNGWTEDEVLFGSNGERVVLLPTGIFVVEVVDSNANAYVNFLWNEYQLS